MPQNFIACDRDQVLLLPPALGEWLPAGHLAWFVLGAADELDLGAVYGYYRQDGSGRPAHDPRMMVALLLYAYSVGVTSSRGIERRCVDDVAFRVIAGNTQPDHATIARFLVRHREAVSELFVQVLGMCGRAGMVRVGTVAVDSTKLAANASASQNVTFASFEEAARRIIQEAIDTDRREDELYGDARGDELPPELADPATRKARIKELLEEARREREQAEQERAGKVAEHEQHRARTGRRKNGRPPSPKPDERDRRLFARKYNRTDPDSVIVRHRGMLLQGYNVQTVANERQLILAATPISSAADQGQLTPALQTAQANLARAGIHDPISEVLADSGYWNSSQIRDLTNAGHRVLVPPPLRATTRRPAPDILAMRDLLDSDEGRTRYRRRQHLVEPVFSYIKHRRQITRVWRRGKHAVQAEIDLIATTHNLLKLRNHLQTA